MRFSIIALSFAVLLMAISSNSWYLLFTGLKFFCEIPVMWFGNVPLENDFKSTPFFSKVSKISEARLAFSSTIALQVSFNFCLISIKSGIDFPWKCTISSRLFSLRINLPVSMISREISQLLSSSVFSMVKSMRSLVSISSVPASAMMASTASVSRFSVSRETSNVIGRSKS